MHCLLCGHDKVHKHGRTEKGQQRYKCPHCGKTFPEHFESLYYGRHLDQDEGHTILSCKLMQKEVVCGELAASVDGGLWDSGLSGQKCQSKSTNDAQPW